MKNKINDILFDIMINAIICFVTFLGLFVVAWDWLKSILKKNSFVFSKLFVSLQHQTEM